MLVAGVLCVAAAVISGALGIWSLRRPRTDDPTRLVLRAVAPTQLAAAVMLAAGGFVAITALPQTGLVVLIVCILGAMGTVAAGSWQSARFALRQEAAAPSGCAGSCASCTLSCH